MILCFIFERLCCMRENKTLYIYIYFATFRRKRGTLIPDLHFYNVKMPTNINPEWWKNTLENHKSFWKDFGNFIKFPLLIIYIVRMVVKLEINPCYLGLSLFWFESRILSLSIAFFVVFNANKFIINEIWCNLNTK